MAHNVLPGRVLQRADAPIADDGDDADGVLLPGRAFAGNAATATATPETASDTGEAAIHGKRGGEQGRGFREVAAGGLEDASGSDGGGGGGGGERGRHGRTWWKRLHVEARAFQDLFRFSS